MVTFKNGIPNEKGSTPHSEKYTKRQDPVIKVKPPAKYQLEEFRAFRQRYERRHFSYSRAILYLLKFYEQNRANGQREGESPV